MRRSWIRRRLSSSAASARIASRPGEAGLLATGAEAGDIRADIAPGELAGYCLHALGAAGSLPSEAAVRRLLAVTMSGLRPQPAP